MSSIITDHQILNKLIEYESIFKHYGFETKSRGENKRHSDDFNRDKPIDFKNLYETRRGMLERNESNKKTINAKTIIKKPKQTSANNSPTKSKKTKNKSDNKVCSESQQKSDQFKLSNLAEDERS